MNDLTPVGGGK